jgi:hypothetical protein
MKAYSGRKSITPFILYLALDRGECFNFRTLVALPPGKEARSTLNRRLSGRQCLSGRFEEAKKSTASIGNRNSDRLDHRPVIVLTISNTEQLKKSHMM